MATSHHTWYTHLHPLTRILIPQMYELTGGEVSAAGRGVPTAGPEEKAGAGHFFFFLMASSSSSSATATDTATAAAKEGGGVTMSSTGHPYGVKPWGNFLTDGGGKEVSVRRMMCLLAAGDASHQVPIKVSGGGGC